MATVSDVITQARQLLQDTRVESQRHSDSSLLGYLDNALRDARKLRPDLFYPYISYTANPYQPMGLLDSLPIDEMYFSALVGYVVGMAELEEDEFAVDGRAQMLMQRYSLQMSGKGV